MIMTILNLVNNNQGVLAVISIILTILGFFVTNKNINRQKQIVTGGENSMLDTAGRDINKKISQNQKTGMGSFAQQAGRDIK